jgi:glutaminase
MGRRLSSLAPQFSRRHRHLQFSRLQDVTASIFAQVKKNVDGQVATYIPQLALQDPEAFGVSIMTVDGRTIDLGDSEAAYSMQSVVKPFVYCLARERLSLEEVHAHVGYEPSGREFNAHVLTQKGLPHNPLINAGAIMVASLIAPDAEPAVRFEAVKQFVARCAGAHGGDVGFDPAVYLSEDFHGDRNRSLAYYMRENRAFAPRTNMEEPAARFELAISRCGLLMSRLRLQNLAAGDAGALLSCVLDHRHHRRRRVDGGLPRQQRRAPGDAREGHGIAYSTA